MHQRRSYWPIVGMSMIIGLLIAFVGVATPVQDDIDFLRVSARIRSGLHWNDLWVSWNGHRQVLPRLIASGLLRVSDGDFRILLLASYAVVLATVPAVLRILPEKLPHRTLLAALTMFSVAQNENWLWGYQLAWFMVNAGVLWAIALSRQHSPRWQRTALIVAACVVATLSSAHGILSWLGVAMVYLVTGRRRSALVFFGLSGIAGLVVLDSGGATASSVPRTVVVFVQMMAGSLKFPSAWIRRDLPGGGAVPFLVGALLLSAVGWVLVKELLRLFRRPLNISSPTEQVCFENAGVLAVLIYSLIFMAMTSVARAAPKFQAPAQSRYVTVTMYGFLSLVSLLFLHSHRGKVISRVSIGLLVLASAAALPSLSGWTDTVRREGRCVTNWRSDAKASPDCFDFGWDATHDAELKLLRADE
jgi:hypothetical protein